MPIGANTSSIVRMGAVATSNKQKAPAAVQNLQRLFLCQREQMAKAQARWGRTKLGKPRKIEPDRRLFVRPQFGIGEWV